MVLSTASCHGHCVSLRAYQVHGVVRVRLCFGSGVHVAAGERLAFSRISLELLFKDLHEVARGSLDGARVQGWG